MSEIVFNLQRFADIENSTDATLISGTSGNDSIDNDGDAVTINAGAGNDSIRVGGAGNSSVDAGAGDDTVGNYGINNTIIGGTGNDSVYDLYGGMIYIYNNGDGNDTIENFNISSTLVIPDSNRMTVSSGSDVIVVVGNGSILLDSPKNPSAINIVSSRESVHPVNVIDNYNAYSLIKGTSYVDSIRNSAAYVTINAGADNDIVINSGSGTSINCGAGHDSVWNQESGVTIEGGKGNDTVENDGDGAKIDAGAGNDYIANSGSNVTITGGAGNDYIDYGYEEDSKNVLFNYADGDGNDTIEGFDANDTLSISGSYSTAKSGDDIIVTVGKGKITLLEAADLSAVNIKGTKSSGGDGGSTVSTSLNVTDKTKSPVKIASTIKTVNASKRTAAVQITGNKLANSIVGGSGKDSLYGGDGNDTILGNAGADKLYGQAGNDYLNGGAGNDSLAGGAGNNTLTGGAGNDVFFYGGGKDVITDYAEGDKIKISSGTAQISTSGNNVIFTVGKGKITVSGAADKTVSYVDASGSQTYSALSSDVSISGKTIKLLEDYLEDSFNVEDYGAKLQNIDASEVLLDINITGNKLANKIIGSGNNETLIGGKGNDTLTGGEGSDVFLYNNGDGNDIITDYNEEDIIQFTTGTAKVAKSGKNVIFTLGKGKLTVTGGASKVITYIDAKGEHTYPEVVKINGAGTGVTILENYMKDSFDAADYGEGIKTIDASAVTHDLSVTGNKLANSILGSENNETLYGGKGNDTLTGGDGSDVFVYNSGDGNDLITDYNEEDKIRFESGKVSVKKSGKHVVFTVGSGKITVKNAAAKTVTYIDASGKTNYFPTTPSSSVIWKDKNTTAILRETYSQKTFTASDYNASIKTIDASSVTHNIKITGNGKANQILGGYENDTINGGKGNDTLQGGYGADVFTYANGDGKDIILDYAEEDKIQITKGTAKVAKSGSDVIFTIGSGKITVLGAADKTVSYIQGGKKKTYGGSASNVLEDDNFITANNLSALVESKAVDYAFMQTNLTQKNNRLPSVTYSSKK